jgi:hypothetical protein
MRYGRLKRNWLRTALVLSLLSLTSCKVIKRAPDVWQCTVAGEPKAFYCVNTKTGKRWKLALDDPQMSGAQCVSPDDYLRLQRWVDYLIGQATSHCK